MDDTLKNKTVRGSFWVLLEQLSVQGLNFGMGVVLARLLTPNDYGTVALVTIFIALAQVLVTSGLGQALVQKKEIDDLDISSVLYLSVGIAAFLYAVLFFLAPAVAAFYRIPELCPVLRVLSLTILFNAVNSVQSAELCKLMKFNLSFRVSLVTTVASAVVGIGLAFAGFGVWALVWSSVSGSFVGMIARAFVISWRPQWMFSWNRIRPLFGYGSKLMANALIAALVGNLYGVLMGRFYSRADLAFVNKGRNIPELLLGNLTTSLVEVSLPALVRLQDDRERMLNAMSRLLTMSSFVVFPLMFFLAAVSRELTLFFYGEKWSACIVYMSVTSALFAFGPIAAVNQKGVLAIGRSDVYLKVGILRSALSVVILIVGLAKLNVLAWVVMNAILFGPLSSLVDMLCGSHFLHFSLKRQMRAILPGLGLGVAVACPVLAINLFCRITSPWHLFLLLASESAAAAVVVLAFSVAFRMKAVCEIVGMLEQKFGTGNRFVAWLHGRMREDGRCLA